MERKIICFCFCVLCNFHIKTMFGSSLPLVVCRRAQSPPPGSCLIFVISVCLCIVVSNTCCVVYLMLPVSLDCQFLIAPSVFSNVYLN
jgi:hypothetical protein